MMRWVSAVAAAAMLALTGCSVDGPSEDIVGTKWVGCRTFASQEGAQTAWLAAGKPRVADPDGNGIACEMLPRSEDSQATDGKNGVTDGKLQKDVQRAKERARKRAQQLRQQARKRAQQLRERAQRLRQQALPDKITGPQGCVLQRQPVSVRLDADKYPQSARHMQQAWQDGHPRVLHMYRPGAEANRRASLAGIDTVDSDGNGTVQDRDEYPLASTYEGGQGAHVVHVDPADNRGSGSSIGMQMRRYCDWQSFQVQLVAGGKPVSDRALLQTAAPRSYRLARAGNSKATQARADHAARQQTTLLRQKAAQRP